MKRPMLRSLSLLALGCAALSARAVELTFENTMSDGFFNYASVDVPGTYSFYGTLTIHEGEKFDAVNPFINDSVYRSDATATAGIEPGIGLSLAPRNPGGGARSLLDLEGTTGGPGDSVYKNVLLFSYTVAAGTPAGDYFFMPTQPDLSNALPASLDLGAFPDPNATNLQFQLFYFGIRVDPSVSGVPGPAAAASFVLMALRRRKRA